MVLIDLLKRLMNAPIAPEPRYS